MSVEHFCTECGLVIPPTGKPGRPGKTHAECKPPKKVYAKKPKQEKRAYVKKSKQDELIYQNLFLLPLQSRDEFCDLMVAEARSQMHKKGWQHFFKGVPLEVQVNLCLEKLGATADQLHWSPGSHEPSRDVGEHGIKSGVSKPGTLSFSGPRTQKSGDTLSGKIEKVNEELMKHKEVLVCVIEKNIMKFYFFNTDLIQMKTEFDWTEKYGQRETNKGKFAGWDVTAGAFKGTTIAQGTSSQLWYVLNTEHLDIKDKITVIERKLNE